MKKVAILAFSLLISVLACKKDKDNSAYSGTWAFKSSEGQFDTTFVISITDGGDFTHQIMVSTNQAILSGSVNNNGLLSGKIASSGFTFAYMSGTLQTSGTGSGNYYILNDTIAWTATKR